MKHIVSLSGGKDSTAMLLMMLEKNMPIDEIIFCDTGMEFPAMYTHLDKVEQYTGRKITRLKSERSFEYYMFERKKTHGKNIDRSGLQWPMPILRWCTGRLKTKPYKKYIKEKYKGEETITYIGIAYDELERRKKAKSFHVHPLFDWQITEKQALQYCYDRGFNWNGLYEMFNRVSCWCCPLQSLKELYQLYTHFPEFWQKLKDMDRQANNNFRSDYTVEQLEKRFKTRKRYEDNQTLLW